MGSYLNPGNKGFRESLNSEIYIDKTGGRAERADACENARAMDIATFGQLMFDRLRIFVNELV